MSFNRAINNLLLNNAAYRPDAQIRPSSNIAITGINQHVDDSSNPDHRRASLITIDSFNELTLNADANYPYIIPEHQSGITHDLIASIPKNNLRGCCHLKRPEELNFLEFFLEIQIPIIWSKRLRSCFSMHNSRWSLNKKFNFSFAQLKEQDSATIRLLCNALAKAYNETKNEEKKQQIKNALAAINVYWLEQLPPDVRKSKKHDANLNAIEKIVTDIAKVTPPLRNNRAVLTYYFSLIEQIKTKIQTAENIPADIPDLVIPNSFEELKLFFDKLTDADYKLAPLNMIELIPCFQFLLLQNKKEATARNLFKHFIWFFSRWLDTARTNLSPDLIILFEQLEAWLQQNLRRVNHPLNPNCAPPSQIATYYEQYNSILKLSNYIHAFYNPHDNEDAATFNAWSELCMSEFFLNAELIYQQNKANASAVHKGNLYCSLLLFGFRWEDFKKQRSYTYPINAVLLHERYLNLLSLIHDDLKQMGIDPTSLSIVDTDDPNSGAQQSISAGDELWAIDPTLDCAATLLDEINSALNLTPEQPMYDTPTAPHASRPVYVQPSPSSSRRSSSPLNYPLPASTELHSNPSSRRSSVNQALDSVMPEIPSPTTEQQLLLNMVNPSRSPSPVIDPDLPAPEPLQPDPETSDPLPLPPPPEPLPPSDTQQPEAGGMLPASTFLTELLDKRASLRLTTPQPRQKPPLSSEYQPLALKIGSMRRAISMSSIDTNLEQEDDDDWEDDNNLLPESVLITDPDPAPVPAPLPVPAPAPDPEPEPQPEPVSAHQQDAPVTNEGNSNIDTDIDTDTDTESEIEIDDWEKSLSSYFDCVSALNAFYCNDNPLPSAIDPDMTAEAFIMHAGSLNADMFSPVPIVMLSNYFYQLTNALTYIEPSRKGELKAALRTLTTRIMGMLQRQEQNTRSSSWQSLIFYHEQLLD